MSIDTLRNISGRHDAALFLFFVESVPVVGAVASVPGVVMSLALIVSNAAQAAFKMIQAQFSNPEKEAKLIQQADQKFGDAGDWTIVFFNQIANLCTAGILNNIIVKIALQRASDTKAAEGEREKTLSADYNYKSCLFNPAT